MMRMVVLGVMVESRASRDAKEVVRDNMTIVGKDHLR